MTTGLPSAVVSRSPITRASTSDVPPGANGTTIRIGLFGHASCAPASSGDKGGQHRHRGHENSALHVSSPWVEFLGIQAFCATS